MAYTRQITVNAIAPTAIVVKSNPGCSYVRVIENMGVTNWPTTDLLIIKADPSLQPVRVLAGRDYTEPTQGQFQFAIIPFYVQTVTGTTTIDVDEGPSI